MEKGSVRILSFAITATAWALVAPRGQAQLAYAISNYGRSLIQFDLATPGTVTTIGNFSGASINVDGIDFRPADGQLYGYNSRNNTVVTINRATAVTTLVSTPSTASSASDLGIDFNPVADRMRLVNGRHQNLRINVATGVTTVDAALAYAAGDPNVGANPLVIDAAYTNPDNDPGTSTSLFYLDYGLDILVSTAAPNAGTLNTVGALGVNTSSFTGFDIALGNSGYAILNGDTGATLYSINLATGAATAIGAIPASFVYGLAITVPEPATNAALVGLALAGLGVIRHVRRTAAR